jgi:hypothetical protein
MNIVIICCYSAFCILVSVFWILDTPLLCGVVVHFRPEKERSRTEFYFINNQPDDPDLLK